MGLSFWYSTFGALSVEEFEDLLEFDFDGWDSVIDDEWGLEDEITEFLICLRCGCVSCCCD